MSPAGARWGLHGSKWGPQGALWCPAGARLDPFGHPTNNRFGLHVIKDVDGIQYLARFCAKIAAPGQGSTKYGAHMANICIFGCTRFMIFVKNRGEFQSGRVSPWKPENSAGRTRVAGIRWPAGPGLLEYGPG